jgi:hypothetical protein
MQHWPEPASILHSSSNTNSLRRLLLHRLKDTARHHMRRMVGKHILRPRGETGGTGS